jgi:hypothetical protein
MSLALVLNQQFSAQVDCICTSVVSSITFSLLYIEKQIVSGDEAIGSVKQKAKDPSMPRGVIDIRPDSSELSLEFHLHVISFHIYNVDDVYKFNDVTVFF